MLIWLGETLVSQMGAKTSEGKYSRSEIRHFIPLLFISCSSIDSRRYFPRLFTFHVYLRGQQIFRREWQCGTGLVGWRKDGNLLLWKLTTNPMSDGWCRANREWKSQAFIFKFNFSSRQLLRAVNLIIKKFSLQNLFFIKNFSFLKGNMSVEC